MSVAPASSSLTTTTKPVNPNANFVASLTKIKNSDTQSSDTPLTDSVTLTQISEGRTDNLSEEMSKLSDESTKSSDPSLTSEPPPTLTPTTLTDTPVGTDQTDTGSMDHIRLGSTQDALIDIDTSRLSEAKNFGQFVSAVKRFLATLTGSQAKTSDLLPLVFTGMDNDDNNESTTKPASSMTGSLDTTG